MPFEILIPEKLKDKSIQNLYDFINRFRSMDWHLLYYGFILDERKTKQTKIGQLRLSIPTNYGCIIFPSFYYDKAKFFEYAGSYVARDKLMNLKKQLEEEEIVEDIVNDYDMISELEGNVIRKIASRHLEIVESVEIELIVPVVVETDAIPQNIEDSTRFFKKQSDRMKKLVDFCKDSFSCPFADCEIHQWDLQYADPEEVPVSGKEEDFMDYEYEDFMDYYFNELMLEAALLEEEPEEKGYIAILRTGEDAKVTIRGLEKRLDKALAPIKQSISKKTCFVTLVRG